MTLEEKKDVCSKALMSWIVNEQLSVANKHNEELINELFTAKVLLKKLKAFNIDIFLPDALLVIIAICSDENPGMCQLILKDLLSFISKRDKGIKPGYCITSTDFSTCFATSFPLICIDHISKAYNRKWNAQKYKVEVGDNYYMNNKCDTPEWWLEVMQ